MRQRYISIRAKISLTVALLTIFCLAMLSTAVYVLSRDALLQLQGSNLDLKTRMKQNQITTMLDDMVNQMIRLTTSNAIQQTMQNPDDSSVLGNMESTIASNLDNSSLVRLDLYTPDKQPYVRVSLSFIGNDDNLPNNALPLESNNTNTRYRASTYVNQTGLWVSGPYVITGQTTHIIGFTIPVVYSRIWNQLETTEQLADPQNTVLGYATGQFSAFKLQQSLSETSSTMASAGICSTALGVLLKTAAVKFLLPHTNCDGSTGTSVAIPKKMYATLKNNETPEAQVNGGPLKSLISTVYLPYYNRQYVVVLQQAHHSVYSMVYNLRNIILIAIFCVSAGMILITFLLSSFGTRQIIKLKEATSDTTRPDRRPRQNWFCALIGMRQAPAVQGPSNNRSSIGKVPERVGLRKHLRDELDLITQRFNDMSDELSRQYRALEDRVEARKSEIESAQRVANEANNAKSHFLARVTHELRTPLNGILGTASLCMDENNVSQIHTSLKTIFKCGELLLHLLTDLLSFSQNEVENLELDEHEFMIAEATSQLSAIFREQSSIGKVTLNIETDPSCQHLILFGDINRILQVVFNLMSNSLKFTPEGGAVTFSVRADSIPAEPNMRLITFVVKDTGPGIAPHLQSRVFEAFVQGDLTSTVRKAGVGLGLSICRQLAERMNGSIELESTLGKGAMFTFKVPLKYVPSQTPAATPGSSKSSDVWPEYELYSSETIGRKAELALDLPTKKPACAQPSSSPQFSMFQGERPMIKRGQSFEGTVPKDLHVLVTDDNKVNQEVMVRMLNLEGLKDITVANDGREAIAQVTKAAEEDRPFDVIFMDVQMPNLDGRQATLILRTEMGIQIPIVGVSAFANDENVENCLAVGMSLFLSKPLRRPHLHKLLLTLGDLPAPAPPLPTTPVPASPLGSGGLPPGLSVPSEANPMDGRPVPGRKRSGSTRSARSSLRVSRQGSSRASSIGPRVPSTDRVPSADSIRERP